MAARAATTTMVMLLAASAATLSAASEKEARVTVIVRDVNLLPEDAKPRPAVLNEKVQEDTGVRTGNESRSELTFTDFTITRLSANTIFSFNRAGRNVHLNSGAMLLRVPKDSGGASMRTDACSVAITGTTVVLQATRLGRNKLYVLEGHARMALNKRPNDWSTVGPGQMLDVPPGANQLPAVQDFDVNEFMKSNPLITDFPPLPSRDLIYASTSGPGRVYPSTPVSGGPSPPSPPFIRIPIIGGGGIVSGGNPTGPDGGKTGVDGGKSGTGGQKIPKRPRPPIVKATPTPTPVIGRKIGPGYGKANGVTTLAKATPTPRPRKRRH